MKKGLKGLITALLATSCCASVMAFTGCGGNDTNGNNNNVPCTEHVDANFDNICDNCGETISTPDEDEYTISVVGLISNDLDIGDSIDLAWEVRKNNVKLTSGADVTVSLNSDCVTFNKTTGKITAVKKGSAIATLTLDSDPTVKATVRYTVHDYFFNHKLDRGEWNSAFEDAETNPKITITGGQASVLVKEASTRFVFKYTLNMSSTDVLANQSFGIASFLPVSGADVGDNALWFGLRGTNARGIFGVFVKQFYDGWGSGDEYIQSGYDALDLGFENLELIIIRDGLDYYYSIGGYYEKYTVKDAAHADIPTYAGIYSQTVGFDVSNYSYSNSEADVSAAIKEYYNDRGVAAISINESYQTEVVRGQSETYTAAAYPLHTATGVNLEWSLDKSEMTEGADGTSISVENGKATLTLDASAAGYVYVICSTEVGGKTVSKRLRVEILEKDLTDNNDHITVYGGVVLNNGDSDNWSITFPESRISQNGISITGSGHEDIYEKTKYCAILNNNYGKDFELEFKFSGYKNNSSSSKLQVSLGANYSNFYLVYNSGSFRIESFTQGTESNGFTTAGWHNTNWITGFNPDIEHTFKLTVSDRGVYSVFIDGQQYEFYAVDGNQALANQTTLVRKYADYDRSLPIKFATSGCAVTVSDIKVTDGTHESAEKTFWSEHQSYEFDGTDSFKMVVPIITDTNADGWQYGSWADYKTYYTGTLDDGGYAIEFDTVFGSTMTDGKLIMRVGNNGTGSYEIQLNNKPSGLSVAFKKDNNWAGSIEKEVKLDVTNPLKISLRLEVKGGKLRLIANGRTAFEVDYALSNISSNSNVEFYMFNATLADVWSTSNSSKYAQVSNFKVYDRSFTAADVYELNSTAADNNIEIYYATDNTPQTVPVRILHNGAAATESGELTLKFEFTSDDAEYFEWNETNRTVCGKNVPSNSTYEGVITVSLMNGSTVVDTMDYYVYVYNKPTSNNYVNVRGGVILDSASDSDANYTLTFPMSKINTNGVGAESYYDSTPDYSADLKTTVKGDFAIEFTVSDYVTSAAYPKLMISLGGDNNQFYVVYNREGSVNHIETFVNASSTGGHGANGWISSDAFENFDTAAKHTYKIECIDGIYHVYLDGKELRFSFDSDSDKATATLYRNIRNYESAMPIRISTNGVSAKVSDIKITDLNDGEVDLPAFYSYNKAYADMSDTSFTMQLTAAACKDNNSNLDAWNFRYSMYHKMSYLEPINTNTQIEFDIEFGGGMKDGKLVMQTGDWEYHFMDKTGNGEGLQFQLYPNGWGEPSTSIAASNQKLHVVFERNDGKVWLYVNGIRVLNGRSGANVSTELNFYIFGETADIGKTAIVSNFTEKNYSEATRYEYYQIAAEQSNISIKPNGEATEIGLIVTSNDTQISIESLPSGMTLEYTISDSEYIKLDADNNVYATGEFTNAQTATVTVSLKKDGVVLSSVNVGITATSLATENSILSVSGGAVLNYENDPDEAGWSVTFPQSNINVDGIVNEASYVEAGYSANLKQKVQGDTTVEFKVSNYNSVGTSPKLMVSLGGEHNQFYFVYTADNGFRLEVVVPRVNTGYGYWEDNGWLTSAWDASFNPEQEHTFKIELVGGVYEVYRKDGNGEYQRIIVGENNEIGSHTMATSYNSYISEKPVRIATKGVACTVSGISVTTGNVKQFYHSTALVDQNDSELIIKAHKDGWSNETSNGDMLWKDRNSAHYTGAFASNQTMTFDLKFDTAMSDGKLALNIGGNNYYIENKLKNESKINICGNGDWGGQAITGLTNTDFVIKVTIARNGGNVTVTLNINGSVATFTNTAPADNSSFHIWMFNENASEQNATAIITNVNITDN